MKFKDYFLLIWFIIFDLVWIFFSLNQYNTSHRISWLILTILFCVNFILHIGVPITKIVISKVEKNKNKNQKN